MCSNPKRMRGRNFTDEDALDLIGLISHHKHIIENKTTNAVTNQEKAAAWRVIEKKFNEDHPLNPRTAEQLSAKYDNLKNKARKYAARNRQNFSATGGGPPTQPQVDPILDAIIEIINKKTVYGESNNFDDDSHYDFPQLETIELVFDDTQIDGELAHDIIADSVQKSPSNKPTVSGLSTVVTGIDNVMGASTPYTKHISNGTSLTDNVSLNTPKKDFKQCSDFKFLSKRKTKKEGKEQIELLAGIKSQMYAEKAKLLRLECEQKQKENIYKDLQIEILKEELEEKRQSREIKLALLKEELEGKKLENKLKQKAINDYKYEAK